MATDTVHRFGAFGGRYVPETLIPALDELDAAFDDAMREYQLTRDQHVTPMYEFTCQLATLEPPPPEMQQLFGAIAGKQKPMDAFAQMNAGTISPAEFGAVVTASLRAES